MISILVLGSGCPKCVRLAERCQSVLDKHQINGSVGKITDLNQITALCVTMTPGLIINGKCVSSGRIPTEDQILNWVEEGEQK